MGASDVKVRLLGQDVSLSKTMHAAATQTDKTQQKLGAFGAATRTIGLVSGTALLAMGGAAVKWGVSSVKAFSEAETAHNNLAFAFQKFPKLSDTNVAALERLNTAIQRKTGVDDESIAAGQAVLAQFKLTGTQLQQITPLVVDYARKTGKDVPDAATAVGRALLGNTKALKAMGINYKSTGDATKDFNNVTALMRQKVGGFAENEGKTAAGATRILGSQIEELQEKTGSKLVPALTKATGVGLKVVDWMSKNSGVALTLGAAVVGLTGFVFAMSVATKVATAVQTAWGIATKVVTGLTIVYRNAQMALNLALISNPIGLVVAAIALLVIGLVIAYKKSETFRNVVQAAFRGVAAAGRWLWNNALAPVIRFILNGFATVTSGIGKFLIALSHIPGFGWAKTAGDKMLTAASAARTLASKIRDIPSSKYIDVHIRIGQSGYYDPRALALHFRQHGGPVRRGFPYVVGEKGPELVIPRMDGEVLNARDTAAAMAGKGGRPVWTNTGGRPEVHIHLEGLVMDPVGAAYQIHELLSALTRSRGTPLTFGAIA